jgi:hypothetical protein
MCLVQAVAVLEFVWAGWRLLMPAACLEPAFCRRWEAAFWLLEAMATRNFAGAACWLLGLPGASAVSATLFFVAGASRFCRAFLYLLPVLLVYISGGISIFVSLSSFFYVTLGGFVLILLLLYHGMGGDGGWAGPAVPGSLLPTTLMPVFCAAILGMLCLGRYGEGFVVQ